MSQRQPHPKMSREEIRAVYAQGEDAVIALVEGLFKRIEEIEALEHRLEQLEGRLSKGNYLDFLVQKEQSDRQRA